MLIARALRSLVVPASVLASLLLAAAALVVCPVAPAQQPTLRLAAAADLQPVLPALLTGFEQETGIHVEATYSASAALTAQIQNGAPFDLFLSADMAYPKRLIDLGLADTAGVLAANGFSDSSSPVAYARGTLVLWTRKDSRWPVPSLATLSDPTLQRLAIANPDRAPYGKAAIATLASLKLLDRLRPKFVTAENIAQCAQFAETGNADAGLLSLTAASTDHLKSVGTAFVIPRDLYPSIEQGAVIVTASHQRPAAHRFMAWLLRPSTQQRLSDFGLMPARPSDARQPGPVH